MSEQKKSRLPLPLSTMLEEDAVRGREARLWASIRARRSTGLGGHSEPPRTGQHLPAPLATMLMDGDDLVTERSRLYRAIRDRRAMPRERAWFPALAWSGVATAAMAVALAFFLTRDPVGAPGAVATASGALVQADGAPVIPVDAGRSGEVVRLSDASEIRLHPGARLEPIASSASRFELLLARGRAEFSVTPGGPRRWVIEAGFATVEVVGTVFVVDRSDDGVRVSVSRGVVLVRGERVPGLVQRLTANQSLEVRRPMVQATPIPTVTPITPTKVELDVPVEISVPMAAMQPKRAARAKPQQAADDSPAWKAAVAKGDFAGAYAALGANGFAAEVTRETRIDALLSLADVARLSGHASEAVAPLERILDSHRDDPQAALAAFTLGRVFLDQLGAAPKAAAAFEQAIALHPPSALLADCHARLVEAYARAGDANNARRAATRYRTLFPNGRHLPDLERWTKAE